ncbi:hypothetical protein BJG93_02185 [Paraburkholderia sprentiae WSM5005]|uniref:Uncharacterized protein n=1 Tax=Paraburkholderia sprentiae WSM5005 TaxID=754502 RepID=A0A1I9YDF0_9BURK|nr:hypothetical protein [Paraburkholderia sprentiae]APA84333.1 hypothetical protein BJG93_02185 [Paraburkholderia sprentiae WSM5005]
MDTGSVVIGRAVEDVLTGRLRWVPRRIGREPNPMPPAATVEGRRERDRARKAAQRAKHTGRPS